MGRATLGDMESTELSTDAAGSCDVLGLVGAGEAKTNRSRSVLGLLGWWPVVARPLRVTLVSCIFFHSADSLAVSWVPGGGQRILRWSWTLTIAADGLELNLVSLGGDSRDGRDTRGSRSRHH